MWVGLLTAILALLKGLFGMDKPEETKVEHPKPDMKVGDGKTDKDRLDDLGL